MVLAVGAGRCPARIELDHHPLGHILGAGHDTTGGIDVVAEEGRDGTNSIIDFRVWCRDIALQLASGAHDIAIGHADPREDPAPDEVFPGRPRYRLGDLTSHEVEDVVVGISAPEGRRRFDIPDTPRNLIAMIGGWGPPEQISAAESEAAPMDEQVAHRELVCTNGSYIANPGRYRVTGASHSSFPSSTSMAMAVAVNTLVFDAIPNRV